MSVLILVVDDEPDVELLFRQRFRQDVRAVPVIMITAYGDAETKRKALEGGAKSLLTKPIDFATLRDEIEARLAQVG